MKHIKNIKQILNEENLINMKALTIKDDMHYSWATWVRDGDKTIETRKWSTKYRGDILITCSKSSYSNFAGQAICVAELYDVQKMTKEHEKEAMCDMYEGAYSWFLKNIRPIEPFPISGKLGLFNVELTNEIKYV